MFRGEICDCLTASDSCPIEDNRPIPRKFENGRSCVLLAISRLSLDRGIVVQQITIPVNHTTDTYISCSWYICKRCFQRIQLPCVSMVRFTTSHIQGADAGHCTLNGHMLSKSIRNRLIGILTHSMRIDEGSQRREWEAWRTCRGTPIYSECKELRTSLMADSCVEEDIDTHLTVLHSSWVST